MPEVTTRPTTDLEQPTFSIVRITWGITDSEDAVPSTVKVSSFRYLSNFHRLNPEISAIMPSQTKTKIAQVAYMLPTSLPSERPEPQPYLPTVNAMAPNAAMGARRITIPTMANKACKSASRTFTTGFARRPR